MGPRACSLMLLVDRGLVSLCDPVEALYLTGFKGGRGVLVTRAACLRRHIRIHGTP